MRIRPQHSHESSDIASLLELAFGGSLVSRLYHRLRESPGALPRLSLVADDDHRLVGHVMLSRIDLHCVDGPVGILMLTPLAVSPDRQGVGVGSRLVRAALAAARRTAYPLVVLEDSPAHYTRFGFRTASSVGVQRPSDPIPDAAFQVVTLGEDVAPSCGRVVYPQLMYELGAVGP